MFPKKQKQQRPSPWSQKKLSISNPFPRYGHSANRNSINDEIYIFGGIVNGRSTNDTFMMQTSTFNVCGVMTTGDIPPPRCFHTQVNIGDNIIVYGGLQSSPEERLDNNIYILNTAMKQWYKPPIQGNPNVGRFGHSATVVGSKMYVFGGQSDGYFLCDLVAFDLKKFSNGIAQWEFITPLNDPPTGRTGQTLCAYDDKIYVFGGTDGEKYYNDTWCYDTQTNIWVELSCIGYVPAPRKNHGAAIIDDIIYIFGGKGQDGTEMGDLIALKISNLRWYMFTDMGVAPSSRQGHEMSSIRDKILVLGGDCLQFPKPGEDDNISVLDTSKIKYPPGQIPTSTRTTMQQTPQKLQQSRSLSYLESNPSSPLSPTQFRAISTIDNMDPSGQITSERNTYYNMSYDNGMKSSPPNARQISPSGSQGSLNSPATSKMVMDSRNTSILSPRMGPQVGSPRNQSFPKRPQNGSISSLSSSEFRYFNNIEGESSQPLSPPVGQKQSDESLRKQSPSPSEGRKPFQSQKLAMYVAGTIGDFQNPRQAPRPPNSINNSSSSVNQFVNAQSYSPSPNLIYGSGTVSPTNSLRSPTFDALDHFPAPVSNAERDNFLRELQHRDVQISQFKSRETWLKAELALARQTGYTPEVDYNNVPDGIDTENFMDIGKAGSDRNKVMLAIFRIKQELRKAKATVASQAQISSQKITEAELSRTVAVQEASYYKAKLTAILSSSESELSGIEVERATNLEKRLTQALKEKESLQAKILQLQQTSGHDKSSRKVAEDYAKSATVRAEKAEEAHARALAELATLHARTTTAEAQLRENNTRLAEVTTELSQYRSDSDNSHNKIEQLQKLVEQHEKTIEKSNETLSAINERANETESLWKQARQDMINLEKEAAGLRAELDMKMRDLDRSHVKSNEMERLLIKSQKENETMRAMMQEGITELLNTSRLNNERNNNNTSEDAKKIAILEREIANLKSTQANSQKIDQENLSSVADAMIKISQMESAAMKARSDSAMLQRKLVEASDENVRTKDELQEKEKLLTERTRALEDAELKVGIMRNAMIEKGFMYDSDNVNKEGLSSNRLKELELKYNDLENIHNQAVKKAKDAEEKVKILEIELERASSAGSKSLTPDGSRDIEDDLRLIETKSTSELDEVKQKLQRVENDHKTALHYVKSTEKMLRKMKDELTKSKREVNTLNEKLVAAQKRNEDLEKRLFETENNISARKELKNSKLQELNLQKLDMQRSDFAKEKEKLQEKINNLQSQLKEAHSDKNMVDAEYEILRKEYEKLHRENESLHLIDQELRSSFKDSEKALQDTQNQLDELYSSVSKEFNKAKPKGASSSQERKSWEGSRAILEQQIAEYRAVNEKLVKENSDLEQKWKESENKIALLLDQMAHAVDTYREIEDDIRDSSPRNSNVINSITNELDMLRSQWEASNQDAELSDDEFIDTSWSKLPNDNENDASNRIISAIEEFTPQRNLGNINSDNNGLGNMSNMFNNNNDNDNRILNTQPKGRMIDHIRGQLSLTPPPTPPASSHQI